MLPFQGKIPINIRQMLMFDKNVDIKVENRVEALPVRIYSNSILQQTFVKSGVYLSEILQVLLTVNNLNCCNEVQNSNLRLTEGVNVTCPELLLEQPLIESKVIYKLEPVLESPAYAFTKHNIQLNLKDLPLTLYSINGKKINTFTRSKSFLTYNIYFVNSALMISSPIHISADLSNSPVQLVPPPLSDGF